MASTDTLELDLDPEDFKLRHPFRLIIAGPTQCGKSHLLFNILDNLTECVNAKFQKIIFIYGVYQPIYDSYPNIHFTDDLDVLKTRPGVPTLLILDDVMNLIKDSTELETIFTRGRHEGFSIILLMQSLFYQGNVLKTIRNNTSYYAIFEHLQDTLRIANFAAQLEPKNSEYFKACYEDMRKTPYNYVFTDLHAESTLRGPPYFIKYRSRIHQSEGQILYLDKSQYKPTVKKFAS